MVQEAAGDDVVLSGQRLMVDVVHDGGQIAAPAGAEMTTFLAPALMWA